MIYATMCVGEDWCKKYSSEINNLGLENNVNILTNFPNYFPNCNTEMYHRNVFSYYEKLPFTLKLNIKYKDRVLFFDVDSINSPYLIPILKNKYEMDKESVYSQEVYDMKTTSNLDDESYKELINIYKSYSYYIHPKYLHERIFSLPYKENQTEKIIEEILELQSVFEKIYHKDRKWPNRHRNQKWSDNGCGYGEGGALSIIIHNMNIPSKSLKFLKNII